MTTNLQTKTNDQTKLNQDTIRPVSDIYESDTRFIIKMDMPGISKENLEITLEKEILAVKSHYNQADTKNQSNIIHQEFEWLDYFRSFHLDTDLVDQEKIDAKLENGTLTITLPKSEHNQTKQISIN